MRKSIKIVSINVNGDNSAIIAESTKANPKGVYQQTEKQLERLAKRAGVGSPLALKHLAELGGAKLSFDAITMKKGDEYTKADGSTGICAGGKDGADWEQRNNEEVELGFTAKMKVAEIAFTFALGNPSEQRAKVAPVVAETEEAQVK